MVFEHETYNNFLKPQTKYNTLLKNFTWSKLNSMANSVIGRGHKTDHSAVTIKRKDHKLHSFEEPSPSLHLLSLGIQLYNCFYSLNPFLYLNRWMPLEKNHSDSKTFCRVLFYWTICSSCQFYKTIFLVSFPLSIYLSSHFQLLFSLPTQKSPLLPLTVSRWSYLLISNNHSLQIYLCYVF